MVSSRRYRIACTGFSNRLEPIISQDKRREEREINKSWTDGWRTEEMQKYP